MLFTLHGTDLILLGLLSKMSEAMLSSRPRGLLRFWRREMIGSLQVRAKLSQLCCCSTLLHPAHLGREPALRAELGKD